MAEESWWDAGERIERKLEEAERDLRDLRDWLWRNAVAHDVWPRELPEPVATILARMYQTLEETGRLVRAPREMIGKFLAGHHLSLEEYHLVSSLGGAFGTTKQLGLSPVDDYEAFRLLHFEDERRVGIINPEKHPTSIITDGKGRSEGRVGGFGFAPEEVQECDLTPEQRQFFQQYLPLVFERFAREHSAYSEPIDEPPGQEGTV